MEVNARQKVTGGIGAMRDEGEDFGYQALLHACVLRLFSWWISLLEP